MKTKFVLASLFFATLIAPPAAHSAQPACGFAARRTPAGAWSSSAFYAQNPEPGMARELAVVQQVLSGNVPSGLRVFQPVQIAATLSGMAAKIEIEVAADYLAIGDDHDFVRAPLTPIAAQYLASAMGFALPTTKLVDLVYDAAVVKLAPQPTDWYKSGWAMRYGPNYVVQNGMIEVQRAGRSGLAGGHKKDVVITNLLDSWIGRVAIYGWQQAGNRPIQPLTVVHDYQYEDYSHGIRFVGPTATVHYANGRVAKLSIAQALRDPQIGNVLNGGSGALHDVRAARTCPADFARAIGLSGKICPPQPVQCAD